MRYSAIKVFGLALIMVSQMTGQFAKVSLTTDDQRLRDSDRRILYSLSDEINNFYTMRIWNEDYAGLKLTPRIQLIFENTTPKGANIVYQCQAVFSSGADQRYYDKSVQFIYNEGQSLYFDNVLFEPLASFLGFYAYMILAGEADTYDPLGGTAFYEQARDIALQGVATEFAKGWDDRFKLATDLSANFGLRRAKFAFYYAQDLVASGLLEDALAQYETFIKGLREAFDRSPRDKYTLMFLKAHAKGLARNFTLLNQGNYLKTMITLDSDNELIYSKALQAITR